MLRMSAPSYPHPLFVQRQTRTREPSSSSPRGRSKTEYKRGRQAVEQERKALVEGVEAGFLNPRTPPDGHVFAPVYRAGQRMSAFDSGRRIGGLLNMAYQKRGIPRSADGTPDWAQVQESRWNHPTLAEPATLLETWVAYFRRHEIDSSISLPTGLPQPPLPLGVGPHGKEAMVVATPAPPPILNNGTT